ncbi:Na/Pi cotransporter family protein [bacterium]|nr:Na/Pi cotransporter family protein [bacterium]
MNIFNIFTLLGGLAFFLYGMSVMSGGLEKIAGGKMEALLRKMTSHPVKSLALGMLITIFVQSSSAVTVMLVGLVNSGMMDLSQAIGVIMGSNVGTTVTAWILSLSGIQSDNFFVQLLKPESFSPLLALAGIMMIMGSKKSKNKNVGSVLVGFAVLMYGMILMKDAMSPLADMPEFTSILTAFSNPFLGILVGTIVTAVIQSSAASVGILQALSLTGGISYGMAFPIIMGQNIGTCVSAVLSAIGVNNNAKRVAVVHIAFNVLGTAIFLAAYMGINMLFHIPFFEKSINPFGIAIMHSIFNVGTTLILYPFAKQLEKIAKVCIKDSKAEKEHEVIIDDRLLLSPSFAIAECTRLTRKMAKVVEYNFINSTKLLKSFHQREADHIAENELKIDMYEDKLDSFLLKLSGKQLSDEDSNKITQLLLTIGDYERIGDHASYILKIAQAMNEKNLKFSTEAIEELKVIVHAVSEIFKVTLDVFVNDNTQLAREVEPLEMVIKNITRKVKSRHVARLKDGLCSVESSFMFSDLLNDFRRIAAHCSNIATCTVQIKESSMEKHEYSHRTKSAENTDFTNKYENYKSIYSVSKS